MQIEMSALRVGLAAAGPEFSKQNKKLLWLLEGLIRCNMVYLDSHPHTPSLYTSGVRYQREARGQEVWQDIPNCIQLRRGDCEDLAAWRVAELRQRGIHARGHLKWFHKPSIKITMYHVEVRLPDGSIEDPSKKLGMKGRS